MRVFVMYFIKKGQWIPACGGSPCLKDLTTLTKRAFFFCHGRNPCLLCVCAHNFAIVSWIQHELQASKHTGSAHRLVSWALPSRSASCDPPEKMQDDELQRPNVRMFISLMNWCKTSVSRSNLLWPLCYNIVNFIDVMILILTFFTFPVRLAHWDLFLDPDVTWDRFTCWQTLQGVWLIILKDGVLLVPPTGEAWWTRRVQHNEGNGWLYELLFFLYIWGVDASISV